MIPVTPVVGEDRAQYHRHLRAYARRAWTAGMHLAAARRHVAHLKRHPSDDRAWRRLRRHWQLAAHPERSPHWPASENLHVTPPAS